MDRELDRREFLGRAVATLAGGVAANAVGAAGGQAGGRPNILWIISEDTGPEFGCYGYPLVHTPNVDGLAAQGVRFTNAFTTTPVCSTSRSSFMTGMYATTIGAHNHRSHRNDGFTLPAGVHVFTKYLRDAGYFTALCGSRKTDWNFKTRVPPYDSHSWDDLKSHQPFFAQYQFAETHRKFKRCKDHPVDPAKVTLPPYYPDHPVAREDWALYLETVNVLDRKIGTVLRKLDEDGLAEDTIVFYFGDHGRAHVRGKQWLYDGGIHVPLVIRWPGRLGPGTVREDMVSSLDFGPTCLAAAGVTPPKYMQGQVFLGPNRAPPRKRIFATRDRCDETVDRIRCVRDARYKYIRNFMPERAYAQMNRYKERSYPMLPLLRKLHAAGKLTPVQQLFMAERRPAEELYDIRADPWEVRNLAASADYQVVLERMRAELAAWIVRTDDRGRHPESEETLKVARERHSRKKKPPVPGKLGKRLPAAGLLVRKDWRVAFVDSEETRAQDMKAANVLDGNALTCWHTQWKGKRPGFPHEIGIDLTVETLIRGLRYLPRQDRAQNGRLREFEIYVSENSKSWGQPVAKGQFANSLNEQEVRFQAAAGSYVRLVGRSGYSGAIAAIAELNLLAE